MRQNMKMGIDFTGTSDHVAGLMQEIMEEVGGDGFLFFNAAFDRRYVMEVCDGLVPELQRRGLTRTGYAHKQFPGQPDGVLNKGSAAMDQVAFATCSREAYTPSSRLMAESAVFAIHGAAEPLDIRVCLLFPFPGWRPG